VYARVLRVETCGDLAVVLVDGDGAEFELDSWSRRNGRWQCRASGGFGPLYGGGFGPLYGGRFGPLYGGGEIAGMTADG
jgi:hypothetical protein